MPIAPPVLMPAWMVIVIIAGVLLLSAWHVFAVVSTRRDLSWRVRDIPMAASERSQWIAKVDEVAAAFARHETDLRGLHLRLAAIVRGFSQARSGVDIETATVREILDMADTAGPRSIEARLRAVLGRGRPLDTNPLGHVGELLAVWEQPSFDRVSQQAADQALQEAMEVVSQW